MEQDNFDEFEADLKAIRKKHGINFLAIPNPFYEKLPSIDEFNEFCDNLRARLFSDFYHDLYEENQDLLKKLKKGAEAIDHLVAYLRLPEGHSEKTRAKRMDLIKKIEEIRREQVSPPQV